MALNEGAPVDDGEAARSGTHRDSSMSDLARKQPLPANGPEEAREVVLTELSASIRELAAHYSIEVRHIEAATGRAELLGHQVAGIAGFTGDDASGMIAVRAASALVQASLPTESRGAAEPAMLGDWIAELVNQLLGRTKNKLLRRGVRLHVTPPSYAIADDLIVLSCDRERTSWLTVETANGPLVVMLELHLRPDVTLVEDSGETAQAEGELVLF
jgi:CheY-specific phosphatase CheX